MQFRPLPVLTVFTVISLAILCSLGTWQLQRMAWKSELIEQYGERGSAPSLQAALCGRREGAFGPGFSGPAPLMGAQVRYYALRGEAGWVRVGLMPMNDCAGGGAQRYIFMESGFESFVSGDITRTTSWRIDPLPEPGNFTSRNDPDTNQWYRFDRTAMARALDIDPDLVLDVWARSDEGMPQSLTLTPPAKHVGYALTWFGLAAALLAVYFALHIGRGRLRWR